MGDGGKEPVGEEAYTLRFTLKRFRNFLALSMMLMISNHSPPLNGSFKTNKLMQGASYSDFFYRCLDTQGKEASKLLLH